MIRWNPDAGELTLRVFRALYRDYHLRTFGGSYVAVPKGTPCYTALTLGEIVRRISGNHPAGQAPIWDLTNTLERVRCRIHAMPPHLWWS